MGSNDDLRSHLLYLDYPFSVASIYVYHDDYGLTASTG